EQELGDASEGEHSDDKAPSKKDAPVAWEDDNDTEIAGEHLHSDQRAYGDDSMVNGSTPMRNHVIWGNIHNLENMRPKKTCQGGGEDKLCSLDDDLDDRIQISGSLSDWIYYSNRKTDVGFHVEKQILWCQNLMFFASIDQRSERAAGESACTTLVATLPFLTQKIESFFLIFQMK
ncbi:hypothetical protein ACJX0J_041640, partial [Zea mays]